MIKYKLASLCLLVAGFSSPLLAFDAIDFSTVFPAVVQAHHGDVGGLCSDNNANKHQLQQSGNARINGTQGKALAFCSFNDTSSRPVAGCDTLSGNDRACSITGIDIDGLSLTGRNAFKGSNSKFKYDRCSAGELFIDNSEMGDIKLGDACTIRFSATNSEYRIKSLDLDDGSVLIMPAGDYWIDDFAKGKANELVFKPQGDVRVFIKKKVNFDDVRIEANPQGDTTIIGYDKVEIKGDSIINAFIYSDRETKLKDEAIVRGRITAAKLTMQDTSSVFATARVGKFDLKFGRATVGNVVFDTPFANDVTPLVFVMPTISANATNNDGPASVFLSQVSSRGFSWRQVQPPQSDQVAQPMAEIHWVAVLPGEYVLSDGTHLQAGLVDINLPIYDRSENYQEVATNRRFDVVLNQIQSSANRCWLTSTTKWNDSNISLGIDVSEVVEAGQGEGFGNKLCQPEGTQLNRLNSEQVGYLALESGNGIITLDGRDVRYQFGSDAMTTNANYAVSPQSQCNYLTPLIGFNHSPTLVAGKQSRNGANGGWLRRCQLSRDSVSMVTDEDQYQDNERNHLAEVYGFVALELADDAPVLSCFEDNFNRDDLGSDWAIKTLGNSAPPAINGQRMRITPASGNQSTSSTFQRLFPAEDNLVQVEFDYFAWSPSGGNGGDGVSIILSDASITPQPGSFGGALGYAPRDNGTAGFAGGWIGVGLDEYGNFANPNEGKTGGPGFRPQSITLRGSTSSSYRYLAGTAANLNPAIDVRGTNTAGPNHSYRITVDSRNSGQALVLVERDIKDGNGFKVLVPEFDARNINGQGGVPDDFYLSITGSTGGANNNHEIDNFEVCALDSRPVGQQVHHFEFDYSSNPLTCNPEPMTLRACRNAQCDLFTGPVTAYLAPAAMANGGWLGGGAVNLVDGIAQVSLRSNTPAPVTIGVTSSTPATIAGSDTLCRKGNGPLDVASCTLSFAESGFIMAVPDELSNKPAKDIWVKAVKQGDANQQCVPAFQNQRKTVSFWSDYISPSSGTLPVVVTTEAGEKSVGVSQASAEGVELVFDQNGQARIEVNYADAGQMQLNARYSGSGEEQGLIMNGSSKFVRRPVGLCIESAVCSDCTVNGAPFSRAGEPFEMTVKAMAWQSDNDSDICSGNKVTPNFALSGIELTHELVSPTLNEGGEKGTLGLTEYEQQSGEQLLQQSISEVGVFNFSAQPRPFSYFGYSIAGATSGNIGRFTPYYLTVTPVEPSLQSACGSFTYMDQPFGFKSGLEPRLLVIGKDKQGNETKNYQIGDWWKYTNNWDKRIFSNTAGSSLPPLVEVDAGEIGYLSGSEDTARSAYLLNSSLSYERTPTPIAPFDALLELQLSSDDLKDSDNICYQAKANASCSGINFDDIGLNDDVQLRYGRMVLENGYGPESESLRLPLKAEYVASVSANGEAEWMTNKLDNCSLYEVTSSADAGESSTTGLYMAPPSGFPEVTAYSEPGLTLQRSTLNFGNEYLYFSIPNASGQVPLKQHVAPWLKWFWNYDGVAPSNLYDPRANAYFGTYRGHDKVIFWREVR